MIRTDSLNFIEIIEMIKQYKKIPGIRELGQSEMTSMGLILKHLSQQFCSDSLRPFIFQVIRNGDFLPNDMAYLFDYGNLGLNLKIIDNKPYFPYQIYGTLTTPLPEQNGCVAFPIKNLILTDSLRKEIGLPPLNYSLKEQHCSYNPELIKKYFNFLEN